MLGKWFLRTGLRDQIFLATKFGIKLEKGTWKPLGIDSSAVECEEACNESLRRLGIDHIDLCKHSVFIRYRSPDQNALDYAHRLNPETPVEETMRALKKLKEAGKIRHIGLCEISSDTLRRACKITHVDAVQMEYSPFELGIEKQEGTNLLATCRELGVALVCYSPLGRGFWTGAITTTASVSGSGDSRAARFPRFSENNLTANLKILERYKAIAAAKGCTSAQLSLAWLRKQGDDVIAIPGTKRVSILEENWASLRVSLSDKEEAEVRAFVDSVHVAGERSVPAFERYAYVNTKAEI